MADRDQLYTALRNADAAGDTEAATKIASYIKGLPDEAPAESKQTSLAQHVGNLAAGAVRGAGSIGATILAPIDIASDFIDGKGLSLRSNRERRSAMDAALQTLGAEPDSLMYKGGKLASEVAGTAGIGGAAASGIRAAAAVAPRLAPAINALADATATGGLSAGPAGPTNALARLGTQIAGGAINGGLSAAAVDPSSAGSGAAIGGALPIAGKIVGMGGEVAGSLVRPFFASGQNRIVGEVLRNSATDAPQARNGLLSALAVIPGSSPTTAAAAGDTGLASLQRTMQNASPEFAANLAARETAQNQARTAALEAVAGNPGKITLAEEARDALTKPMRDRALAAAGQVPSESIVASIDRMLSNPENAGKLSQQALNEYRGRIAQFSENGAIDARALYAIRKDIGDTLSGKLQGEAGNLKYASGQLIGVKSLIDDAIEQAGRRADPVATAAGAIENNPSMLRLPSQNPIAVSGGAVPDATVGSARTGWRDYLQTYAQHSIPIDQMKQLETVLKGAQTGTVDRMGTPLLSAAKLNNILKDGGDDLAKSLSAEQMALVRNLQADLNASQIVGNTGRAVGSNTVQNLAQNQLLVNALGQKLGSSVPATSTLGRLLQIPYGAANRQIQERLGNALLDPRAAAAVMAEPQTNSLVRALSPAAQAAYRTAPVLIGQ